MKKLFTLLVIGFSSLLFAQDLDFAQKLNRIDSADLKSVSDEIIGSLRGDFKAVASIESKDRVFVIFYYPAGVSDDSAKNDLTENGINCEFCHKLTFMYYFEGANAHLEIKGDKKYALRRIEGKYLDLFPWWQKHFAPTVSPESLLKEDSKLRYLDHIDKKINLRFVEDQGNWVIRNIH